MPSVCQTTAVEVCTDYPRRNLSRRLCMFSLQLFWICGRLISNSANYTQSAISVENKPQDKHIDSDSRIPFPRQTRVYNCKVCSHKHSHSGSTTLLEKVQHQSTPSSKNVSHQQRESLGSLFFPLAPFLKRRIPFGPIASRSTALPDAQRTCVYSCGTTTLGLAPSPSCESLDRKSCSARCCNWQTAAHATLDAPSHLDVGPTGRKSGAGLGPRPSARENLVV